MNSILSIIRNKSLWLSSLTIAILFGAVPYSIFKYSYFLCIAIIAVMVYGVVKNKKGFTCIVFAYSQMIPYGDLKVGTGATTYIPYLAVFLCWIFCFFIIKRTKARYDFGFAGKLILGFVILAFAFALRNSSFVEIRDVFYYIMSTTTFFYLCFYDPISLEEFYNVLDVIFYFTFLYVIQEMIFHKSPYQAIYNNLLVDYQIRAKGLMGSPLVLSSFLAFYHVSLLTRAMIYKKWSVLNFILLIPLVVLTASKTVIILIAISWLLYLLFSKALKNFNFYLVLILLAGIGFEAYPVAEKFIATPLDRILNSNANQRIGSYPVAKQVFFNNIFGIGISKDALKAELYDSHGYMFNANYDRDFLIFDDAYLTALAGYGIFSFIIFIMYLNPIRFVYKIGNIIRAKPYRSSLFLLFIIWFLQNFSFDSFFYFPVNTFYFIVSGFIIKQLLSDGILGKNSPTVLSPLAIPEIAA